MAVINPENVTLGDTGSYACSIDDTISDGSSIILIVVEGQLVNLQGILCAVCVPCASIQTNAYAFICYF